MRVSQRRIERDRLAHMPLGIFQSAQALERKRQIAENKRVAWGKPGCLFQLLDGLHQLTQL